MKDLLSIIYENVEHSHSECAITNVTFEGNTTIVHVVDAENIFKNITITELKDKYSVRVAYEPSNITSKTSEVELENLAGHLRRITSMVY
jgi:hypothetical protein